MIKINYLLKWPDDLRLGVKYLHPPPFWGHLTFLMNLIFLTFSHFTEGGETVIMQTVINPKKWLLHPYCNTSMVTFLKSFLCAGSVKVLHKHITLLHYLLIKRKICLHLLPFMLLQTSMASYCLKRSCLKLVPNCN